jgi:hypothetical protein
MERELFTHLQSLEKSSESLNCVLRASLTALEDALNQKSDSVFRRYVGQRLQILQAVVGGSF